MKKISAVLAGAALLTALTACGEESPDDQAQAPDSGKITLRGLGTLADYQADATAIRYDKKLVPSGAQATVTLTAEKTGVTTKLEVSGLVPDREYGAHVHVNKCGETGDDAGPHFQHKKDPKEPSVDPTYANPKNEIWLDFTTDSSGNGKAESTVTFDLRDRRPGAVVIHEHGTHTEKGEAGKAGDRLACITLAEE